MSRINCNVTKDLLPLYADKVLSEDSVALVEEHLSECENCRAEAQALFGIIPQAMVADIAESEEKTTGVNRSGMFFAARTFAMKLGQGVAMLLVTSLATIRTDIGLGYRLVAVSAAAACIIGGLFLLAYNEKKIYSTLGVETGKKE